MRIMMLAQFFPPDLGGEERHVHDLGVALAARGHDVSVVTLLHNDAPPFEERDGMRIHRVRSTMQRAGFLYTTARQHAPPFPDPEITAALRRLVAKERPEIVHAHNWILHSFLPVKALSGARLVVTLHDYSLVCARKTLFNGALCDGPALAKCIACARKQYGPVKAAVTVAGNLAFSKWERAATDMFISVSRAVEVLNRADGPEVLHRVIPNFVSDDFAAEISSASNALAEVHALVAENQRRWLSPDKGYLLYVGDLRPEKGVEGLIRAYATMTDVPPLVLVGRIADDLRQRLPAGIVAMGPRPHADVTELRRGSMVALVPSIWAEPFGIVLLEAMATGRPVIASRIGGITEVVRDGEDGLLVPPGDEAALAGAIRNLVDDEALRARLGARARERVADFRASVVVPQIEAAYRDVLSRA